MMTEEWRAVPGFNGFYEVSSRGRVRGLGRRLNDGRWWPGRIKGTPVGGHGYPVAVLHQNGTALTCNVHRLVALAFLGEHPGLEVDHRNYDRTDNRVENLEWVSSSENIKRAYRKPGRRCGGVRGERHHQAKLTWAQVWAIRKRAAKGEASTSIAQDFPVTVWTVRDIIAGKSWCVSTPGCERYAVSIMAALEES